MTDPAPLAAANLAFVRQGYALLEAIDDDAFVRVAPPIYGSGVGAHLRHCLDHYAQFLDGWRAGRIDYDARGRDPRVECDRAVAAVVLGAVVDGLCAVAPGDVDRPVTVTMDCGDDDVACSGADCPSTVRRELMFLVSHTVHHYAIIAQILRHQGIDVPNGFGVAPSTLRHRRRADVRMAVAGR